MDFKPIFYVFGSLAFLVLILLGYRMLMQPIEQNKVVSEKENKMNSINLSKIETEIVEKHSFFEELSEKVQSLKNIYALELSTTKKMLKELKNDYGSISTSSKKIKENEILMTSFIESLIFNDKGNIFF